MARLAVLLAACVLVGLFAPATAASIPPEVRRDLENIRNLSSLSFTKTMAFEPVRSREETLDAFGMPHAAAEHFFAERRHRLVWQGGRFYQEMEDRIDGRASITEKSFDGRSQFLGVPGSTLFRSQLASIQTFGSFFFPTAGFSARAELSPSSATTLESAILHRLETDGRLVSVAKTELNGRSVVEVSLLRPNEIQQRAMQADVARAKEQLQRSITPPEQQERQLQQIYERRNLPPEVLEVFYLDPALNHAAVQVEYRHPDGALLQVTRNSGFLELPDEGVWFPQYSETDLHWYGTNPSATFAEPQARLVIQIEGGVSLEPVPDDLFTLVYTEPGVRIVDHLAPGAPIRFRVAAGEEDLVRALMTLDSRYLSPERRSALQEATARESEPDGATQQDLVAGDGGALARGPFNAQEDSAAGPQRLRWLLLASILIAGLIGGRVLWKRWFV